MSTLQDINLRDLTTWYLNGNPKACTAAEMIETHHGNRAYFRSLIEGRREMPIRENAEIELRDSVDDLLQFYSLIELASLIRFVPVPLPKSFATSARLHLSQPEIVAYYEEVIPLILPQELRLRLLGKHNLVEADLENTASLFAQFICLNAMIEHDSDVDMFRMQIDARFAKDYSENGLFSAIRDPAKFFEHLQVEPADQRPLERGLHGARKFMAFCHDFDTFLSSIERTPLFRSGAWHYHAFWFDYRSAPVARVFESTQESLARLGQLVETDGASTSDQASANLSAMSNRLLHSPYKKLLPKAVRGVDELKADLVYQPERSKAWLNRVIAWIRKEKVVQPEEGVQHLRADQGGVAGNESAARGDEATEIVPAAGIKPSKLVLFWVVTLGGSVIAGILLPMNLAMMLIATAVEKFLAEPLGKFRELRKLDWYHTLVGKAEQKLEGIEVLKGPVGVAILLALPVLLFYFLLSVIAGIHGILGFWLSIAILLYCLGLQDLDAEIGAIVNAIRGGNDDEANRLTQAFSHSTSPVDTASRGRTVVESVFTEANGRVFGVLFWFALLGWFGAVLFRFSNELSNYATQASSGLSEWADRVRNALSWIPARIAALGFAVAGNLTGVFNHWRVTETLVLQHTDTVLKQSGTGALEGAISGDEVESITAAQALVFRTLVVLLAILVVVRVISWVFYPTIRT